LLEGIADANPVDIAALDGMTGMRDWQKRLYGQELLAEMAAV
jgi:hypothetical protein